MKSNPQPQLLGDIEQDGSITYSEGALKNLYFRGENWWEDMLVWADGHGFTVRPRHPSGESDSLVKISKGR